MTCGLHPIDEHINHKCSECRHELSGTCHLLCRERGKCLFERVGSNSLPFYSEEQGVYN